MKIGGSYTVPIEPQLAYSMLQDPDILARCMPGCDHLARIGEDEYEMKMKMVISSVKGLFGGKVRLADQSPPDSFRLIVEGSGKVGFVKGEGLLTLVLVDAATEVKYEGEVQVGGMIAGVGQRLLDVTAKLVIKKFFEKFTGAITMKSLCTHLDQVLDVKPRTHGCEECLKMGDRWVHLRLCRACGHVGCCDSSKNKHATKHFHQTKHPVMQSLEPGEDWGWCYVDEVELGPESL